MTRTIWENIFWATKLYTTGGFHHVDVPWFADRDTMMTTCPDPKRIVEIPGHGCLVGSAEQSFLVLERAGRLRPGRYVACTPCFRNEPVLDDLHQTSFMKVELYQTVDVSDAGLHSMIQRARSVFEWLGGRIDLQTVSTDDGFDIELNGVEIGSYGIRRTSDHAWIYGTGLAEPRFTTAFNQPQKDV